MLRSLSVPCRLPRTLPSPRKNVPRCGFHTGWKPQQQSQPPQLEAASTKPFLGIPGPWITAARPLGAPFRAYGRASNRRPYVTQLLSSLVVYFSGDLASQYIQQRGEHPEAAGAALADNYNPQRSFRAVIIGSIASIPSYHWFIFLSTHFNAPATLPYSHILSLVYKIVISQVIFAPIFNTYFFGMHSLLSGQGRPENLASDARVLAAIAPGDRLAAAWERIRLTVPTSWVNAWKFWP